MRDSLRKYLAAATLLVLPVIAACGEDVMPPPPTGSIVGQVSIEGMGVDGVSVSLSNGASTATAGGGNYRFDNVDQGSYTITISGFPADASFDATSAPASIGDTGGTVTVDFRGTYIRTAAIMGTVTVENMGLGGVTVRLSGMADGETTTDDTGQYAFTGLRAGTYSVEISSFDAGEVSFSSTSGAATVGVGESKVVSFDGTYLRTAGIQGQVSVDGEGLGGVTVTLVGEDEDRSETTNASGQYAFSKLKSGTYQVAISGFDPEDYEFETTSKTATIATGETANVPFEGTLLRTAGIAGRVSVEGMGLDGVMVTLAGAAEATATTSNGGQYAFAGLAAGTYVLSITNPDDNAYDFAEDQLQRTVMLEDDQSAIENFSGTHTRTASVTGMMYLDEAPQDKMYTANEPALAHAGIPLLLQGPGVNDVMPGVTMEDGSFAFEGLVAGSYRILVNLTEEVAAAIAEAGFAFVGDLTGEVVSVGAGMETQVNFPFRITMQTLVAGACMGVDECMGAPVAGVELAVYANADMTGMLGEAMTGDDGTATFHFARADNTGPTGNDNIVFVKAQGAGHEALAVSGNGFTEVSYAGTDRVSQAPAAVTLVNVMANFQFWVKSNAEARGGDMGLPGWNTEVYMGDPEADDAMPLMIEVDGEMMNATMPTDDGEDNMADLGKGSLSYMVDPADLPATFTVMVGEDQAGAKGEMFDQSDALEYTHTGLTHPDMNTAEMNDVGPIYVTFTTQTLTVGVYREVDDEPGWTDYRAGGPGGDGRPVADVAAEMSAELMTRDDRGRLRSYEYDHDGKATTDPISTMAIGKDGMASFPHLPANEELTVRFSVGSDRMLVGETDVGDIDAFGQDLEIGMSYGSFGTEGGAMPEVKLCSVSTDKDNCATFAYQWKTGSVSGMVAGPGGASVSLTAETDNYSDDRSTKTGADSKKDSYRQFAINDIQDGEYTLSTPNTPDNSFTPKGGFDLEIYHDETEDDDNDDTSYVGKAWSKGDADFAATKLRLSIKGFVANDSGDGRARGNEAMAGVTVNLLEAANAKDTAFTKVAATVDTDASGLYSFDNLTENKEYKVAVVATDDYAGLRSLKVSKSGVVKPDEYPAKGVTQEPLMLPSWDHATNMASETTPTASADPPSTVSAVLQNFALVYKTSNVSGNVNDVSSNGAGIIVETAICREYTAADPTASPPVAEECNWQREDVRFTRTVKGGDYDFNGLLEGYYAVWYTGGGLAPANLDPDGKVDDDADPTSGDGSTTSPTSRITSVMGRLQYSPSQDFYVYNTQAGTADELTELVVKEFTADGDSVDLAADISGITSQAATGTDAVALGTSTIAFASRGVTIRTKQSAGASAKPILTTADPEHSPADLPYNATAADGTAGGDELTNITVRVTAANGYNDHDYTFDVTRTGPQNNTPEDLTADGTDITWAAGTFVVEAVANGDSSADIVVDLFPGQTVSVTVGGNAVGCTAGTTDATVHTCTVTGLAAGGQTAVKVEVTSEDDVKAAMTINLQRDAS